MKLKKLLLLPAFALLSSGLSSCALLCTVTWKNWDGTNLEVDKDIFPGQKPSYDNKTPKRPSDAQFDYKFKGWDREIKRVWRFRTVYTATYSSSIRSYNVRFVDTDLGLLHEEVKEYGQMPTNYVPKIPRDAQYTYEFTGWDKEIEKVTGDVTYTTSIVKTVNQYKVKFLGKNNKVLSNQVLDYGKMPTVPTAEDLAYKVDDPSNPDFYKVFDFNCWLVNGAKAEVSKVTKDVTYVAKYDVRNANFYDMTYYFAGEEVDEMDLPELSPEIREGDDYTLPSILSNGHNVEWYLTDDYQKDKVTTIEDVGSAMYLYGKDLGLHDFNITYHLDGGELPQGKTNPEKITFEDVVELENPEKFGYEFVCWTFEPEIEKDSDGYILNAVDVLFDTLEDVELYAHFEPKVYTIYFNTSSLNDEYKENQDVIAYNEDEELMIHPSFDGTDHLAKIEAVKPLQIGYKFDYWTKPNETTKFSGPYTIDGDITLDPKFTINNYSLTFDVNGGKELENAPKSFNIDNYGEPLPEPERYGYDFVGWIAINAQGMPVLAPHESIQDVFTDFFTYDRKGGEAQNLSLKAIWTAHTGLQVSYDLDGGTEQFYVTYHDGNKEVERCEVAYGLAIEEGYVHLEDKDGLQFAGWRDENGNLILDDFEVNSDKHLYAAWNHLYQHQENGSDQFVNDGTIKIGVEKVVNLHNYNSVYLDFTSLVDKKVVVSSSGDFDLLMTPTPVPEPEEDWEHAISDDGKNFSFEFDAEAGHIYRIRVFGTGNEDGTTSIVINPKDEDSTSKPSFEITAALSDSFAPLTVSFDGTLDLIEDPVRAGYEFGGWYYNEKRYEDGDKMDVDDNITLTAKWIELESEEDPTNDPGDTALTPAP